MTHQNGFSKFIDKKEKGAKKKERIRQEKKKIRKETKAYFDQKKEEARQRREAGAGFREEQQSARGRGGKFRGYNADNPPPVKRDAKPLAIEKRTKSTPDSKATSAAETKVKGTAMPLNKFIAHAGFCSRRDAADIVKSGKVTVNGTKILEPGFKVSNADDVKVQGKKAVASRNFVYILLNKPKDYITTTEDPQGRKTVLDLIKTATTERVYPIGRLDRNTTGVLLLTNDGEMAQKLSHPSYEIKKIYEVTLDRQLTKSDLETIGAGVTLEDGFVQPDVVAFPDPKNKHIVGIEIHSGRNRIVRRIFEHLGYDVKGLDRVMYANLTKKNVNRGSWRYLSEKEIRLLKFLNASYKKAPTAKTSK